VPAQDETFAQLAAGFGIAWLLAITKFLRPALT
jgi:hypothetical protein